MSYFSIAAVNRILKNSGAKQVSKEAKKLFLDVLTEHAEMIAGEAVKLANLSGRTNIRDTDVRDAVKEIFKYTLEPEER
ncbi:MAG TPA: histone [Candidatus Deferrimicrobium sp.]|nr:histone [Candidatus Deferrimicrobium sp.]